MLKGSCLTGDPVRDLQLGLDIELSALPPYLYSLWSIRPPSEGASVAAIEAANTIRSVVYEEMLHIALAANLLNALGTHPRIAHRRMTYPGPLPGFVESGPYAFDVGLVPLSDQSVQTFMRIELPEWDVPQGTLDDEGIITLGAFYEEIQTQLKTLPPNAFSHGGQLAARNNPGPGFLNPVRGSASALDAICTIVDQGEGFPAQKTDCQDDGDHEVAHYCKFLALKGYLTNGLVIPERDVYPVISNPVALQYTEEQQGANRQFNLYYTKLLDSLQSALGGETPGIWGVPTRLMTGLSHAAAVLRTAGCVPGTNLVAGPTFEYLDGYEEGILD